MEILVQVDEVRRPWITFFSFVMLPVVPVLLLLPGYDCYDSGEVLSLWVMSVLAWRSIGYWFKIWESYIRLHWHNISWLERIIVCVPGGLATILGMTIVGEFSLGQTEQKKLLKRGMLVGQIMWLVFVACARMIRYATIYILGDEKQGDIFGMVFFGLECTLAVGCRVKFFLETYFPTPAPEPTWYEHIFGV